MGRPATGCAARLQQDLVHHDRVLHGGVAGGLSLVEFEGGHVGALRAQDVGGGRGVARAGLGQKVLLGTPPPPAQGGHCLDVEAAQALALALRRLEVGLKVSMTWTTALDLL